MSDDLGDVVDDALDDVNEAIEDAVYGDDGLEGMGMAEAHEVALAEAQAERLTRQAFLHGVDKQLFGFLFANCLFTAGALASWEYGPFWQDVDPSSMVSGLDTVRGTLIFGIAIYGFWTAFLNIFHGQMKVWPYFLNAVIALSVAVPAISHGISLWGQVDDHLKGLEGKTRMDDIAERLGTIPPGAWLLALGGFLVLWIVLTGLMRGASSGKAAKASGKKRRR